MIYAANRALFVWPWVEVGATRTSFARSQPVSGLDSMVMKVRSEVAPSCDCSLHAVERGCGTPTAAAAALPLVFA